MQADSHTVVGMLSTVVQTHLPALRALHKSIGRVVPVPQIPRSWPSSAKSSAPSSPPLEAMATREDTSQLDLGSSSSSSASSVVSMDTITDNEYGLDAGSQLRTETLTRRRAERPPVLTPLVPMVHGDGSGVKWQYARQGTMLHTLGSEQGCDGAFIRKSFIDGVSYLLRALPDDLDKHELATIEQSLPTQCLVRSVDQETHNGLQMYRQDQPLQQRQRDHGQREEGQLEALLRHVVRKAALQFVLLVYLFARLVTVLIRMAAHYETKYSVSSQLFERSMVVANGAVQCSVMFAEKIGNTGDGRLGQALAKAGLWTLDLMTGAIQEGLSEGIQAINHQPQPSSRIS